jgi:NAD(P)-dependent dehydrogenase (short-subunit alcohol dehydrogenase family)
VEDRRQEMIKTIPMARIGDPADVANLAVFLASSESSYMTGQAINITGGQLMEL